MIKENNSAILTHNGNEINIDFDTVVSQIISIGGIAKKIISDCDEVISNILITLEKCDITINRVISIDKDFNAYIAILLSYDDHVKIYDNFVMHNNNNAFFMEAKQSYDFKIPLSKLSYFVTYPERRNDIINGNDKYMLLMDYYSQIIEKYKEDDFHLIDSDYESLVNKYEILLNDKISLTLSNNRLTLECKELKEDNEYKQRIILEMSERLIKASMILCGK